MNGKVTYIYPIKHRVSFTLVARQHVKYLRQWGIEIEEVDEREIKPEKLNKVTIVHPIFYILYSNHAKVLRVLIENTETLIGFDVCDTNHISPLASYTASQFDVVCVPTTYTKEVFLKSGVMTHIEVIPHGVDEIFLRKDVQPKDDDVKRISELRGFKVLFFLWHSGFRKGADVVANAFARLAKKYNNVYLIVKCVDIIDPFTQFLFFVPNTIFIFKWLSLEDLVALYDAVDLVVVPSRGGGFEINALESLCREKPVIVSEWGAFNDYCSNCIKVRTRKLVKTFEFDPLSKWIHDGYGVDPDPIDLAEKIEYVMNNYDDVIKHYKPIFENAKKYTWENVTKKLYDLLKRYI